MDTILVTGATGNVGAEVVRLLREQPVKIRAAIRPGGRAPVQPDDRVRVVPFDFGDPATYDSALRDVTKLFLLRPPAISNTKRYVDPVIAAARAAGVRQIVFLSLLGAEKNPIVPHRKIEDALKVSGVPWTLLRPSFFMQNLSTTHRADIQRHRDIFVPAGRGKTSFIDVRDIAAVAAKTLTEPGHDYRAYPLTGSAALDYAQVARIFSEILGRPIVYRQPSIPQFINRMYLRGMPWSFILVMVGIYTTARLGLAGTITNDTATLLGRPSITMRQFVADYRACWVS